MIHRVTRADDERLEPYRHVGSPAWLARRELFVAEGRLVVGRLLTAGTHHVHSILVTPTAADALGPQLFAADADVYVCEPGVLECVTGINFHRGCLALARRGPVVPPDALLGGRRVVALEGVGNPDNVGGIFRSAAALGGDGIVLDAACADPLYRKAIRTSMGSVLTLRWTRVDRLAAALDPFRAAGWRVVALTPSKPAIPLAEFARGVESRSRVLFMVGSEGTGLSAAALGAADVRVCIPIDPAVDSLNVVVATAICLERLR